MASHYSIIRYVPDSVADERINVGIVAVGEGGPRVHMLTQWHRVKGFTPGLQIRQLNQFAVALQATGVSLDALRRYSETWTNSIQFSVPRGTLLSTDQIIEELGTIFLRDAAAPVRLYRERPEIISSALKSARRILRERFGTQGRALVNKDVELRGRGSFHRFDLVVGNGTTYFAGQAVSLQVPDQRQVERVIDAAAWAIQDLKQALPDVRAGILAVLPADTAAGADAYVEKNVLRLNRIAEDIDAVLVPEGDFDRHFGEVADRVRVAHPQRPN